MRASRFLDILAAQIATTSGRQFAVREALSSLVNSVEASGAKVDDLLEDAASAEPIDLSYVGKIEASLTAQVLLLRNRIEDYDDHFSRQSRGLSPAVDFLLMEAAGDFGVPPKSVIVTVGVPNNFASGQPTFGFDHSRPNFDATTLAISVPRIEGDRTVWLPITLGHELGHYLMRHSPIPDFSVLRQRIEDALDKQIDSGEVGATIAMEERGGDFKESLSVKKIAFSWLKELACDALAVAIYGPGGYAAMSEFLGGLGDPGATARRAHPPTAFRSKLMRNWLDQGDRPLTEFERKLVDRFDDVSAENYDETSGHNEGDRKPSHAHNAAADSAVVLSLIESEAAAIWKLVIAWVGKRSYWKQTSSERIESLSTSIKNGIPPIQGMLDGKRIDAIPIEIINSAWHATYLSPAGHPVDQLAMKAIDDYHFVRSWERAGGELEPSNAGAARAETNASTSSEKAGLPGAVLAYSVLRDRVNGDDEASRIVMTPLMSNAFGDSSVDLRLGNQFIVFDRSAHSAFDSLAEDDPEPQSMQHRISKAWGEAFYLHPGQLVLAAALEYLVMPEDLSAQVITRSSFGRLGLISATAVQVHPGYHGCLTLELVNLGEIPIAITPGERVAQLMFFRTDGQRKKVEGKYVFPVGPEFSKVKEDSELDVLRVMRARRRNATSAG